jgi:AAA15 family ATPase/GTPase
MVYGANGAGKSSLIYSLLTLKNIVLNPNQLPNGFFNYTFANLGDYEAVVFDHNKNNTLETKFLWFWQSEI